jgi:hypothetical protein
MNFEQLQSAWAAQPPVNAPAIDAAEIKRAILPEFNRRHRMLRYDLFVALVSLVVLPLLAVGNYRYAPPAHPVWYWFYHASWMVFLFGWVVAIVRSIERQGAWREQCTRSLRDLAAAAIASTEAEMASYRKALALVPLMIAFQLVDLYLRFASGDDGWNSFAPRAAFVIGFPLVIGAVFWRHYRVHLAPARARQRAQLRDLS